MWSVEYNAKSSTHYRPFGGQNAKHIFLVINGHWSRGMLRPQWPDFDTCKSQTDAKIEISASNHRRGHQNSKNDIWRYRRSFTLDDLNVPRKGHDIIISVQTMDITLRRAHPRWHAQHPIDVHITSKKKKTSTKTSSSQGTGVETPWNTNFADMTLKAGHRSNKGHGRYNLEIFREDANFQRLGTHNFVTMSRIVRALFSENPRRGCINPRINLRTPQANDTIYLKYGYTPSPEIVKLTKWLRQTSLSWWKRVIQK